MRVKLLLNALLLLLLSCSSATLAQNIGPIWPPAISKSPQILTGPMVGFVEMREAGIWVQTNMATKVKAAYFPVGKKDSTFFTDEVSTEAALGYSAKLIANRVMSGKRYNYIIYINGKAQKAKHTQEFKTLELYQHRRAAPDYSFAVGSCFFANDAPFDRPRPYGGSNKIFTSIHNAKPDFMVWLGDNIYQREPDWNTRTGMLHRYTHARATPELAPLLANTPQYATWDDHDYGPNDADRSFHHKEMATELFNAFWMNLNTNVTGAGGITSTFQWNDAQFFLMDDRYFRAPNEDPNPAKDYLGKAQIQWLLDALTTSKATFKFVCIGGQVISNAAKYENYATYPRERQALLDSITARKIAGVFFFSGDRHHTELSELKRKGTYSLYDLTCSPLTSGVPKQNDEGNTNLVPNTSYWDRNFGIIEIKGGKEDRHLNIKIMDVDGKLVWEKKITANELK